MRSLLFALVLWAAGLPVRAQKEFNTWCFGMDQAFTTPTNPNPVSYPFGNGIKIVFSDRGPLPADTCTTNLSRRAVGANQYRNSGGNVGNATVSDAAGQLLFYTEGFDLLNRRHRLMHNGELWPMPSQTGVQETQPVVIVPTGGARHYVFYWLPAPVEVGEGRAYDLAYAVVDMRLQSGDGAVVSKGTVLARTYCPRLTAVRHANNRDFWVLTRDLDGRGFLAFGCGPGAAPGAAGPVVSLAGQGQYSEQTELKAAPNGRRLVCSTRGQEPDGPQGRICVYDFDPATGQVSQEVVVRRAPMPMFPTNISGRPLGGDYQKLLMTSASFSPDSRLLYTVEQLQPRTTYERRAGDMYQYDLGRSTPAAVAASRRLVSDVPFPLNATDDTFCMGMQLAPDTTLWAAQYYFRGPFRVPARFADNEWKWAALVRHPNVYGPGCGFVAEGYPYGQWQFPNLITNMLYAPAVLNHAVACPDDSVQFWASSAGLPAGLRWDFGEPGSGPANAAAGQFVAHRYARAGTYTVRLTLADGRVLTQAVAVAAGAADFTGQNVFTPNADGLNEAFEPVRGTLPGGQLRVFSRWGQRVYAAAAPPGQPPRWDGRGSAPGTHFWELTYPDCQGRPAARRGTVELIR